MSSSGAGAVDGVALDPHAAVAANREQDLVLARAEHAGAVAGHQGRAEQALRRFVSDHLVLRQTQRLAVIGYDDHDCIVQHAALAQVLHRAGRIAGRPPSRL